MSIDRLEDRAEIADQMFRYARATDWLETDRHREVFVGDCVFASPHSGDVHGVDGVVEWMNRALAPFGPDTATAVSYVRAWHRHRDHTKADMVLWGEYHDRWLRVDGRWRIEVRRVLEAGIEPRREGGAPNPRRAKG